MLIVTHQQGGRFKFERTGVYPEYLLFHSPSRKRNWRFKLRSTKQTGVLKVNGIVAFNYSYGDFDCKIQEVKDGLPVSEWIQIDVMLTMRD
ncbi:hypothetical protein ACH3O9_03980 [Leeuwenhoekiella sp. A16]|uniref:hypothetical protein n=1 Tax=unclassified Leeuwenhoekiella TaxID=2615029 RepID=UPI003A80A44B